MADRSSLDNRLWPLEDEILDVAGAAAVLKVSKSTIYHLLEDRGIPARKVGKSWRFSKMNLIEWVAETGKETNIPKQSKI